jgi:hypothetical protein
MVYGVRVGCKPDAPACSYLPARGYQPAGVQLPAGPLYRSARLPAG